MTTINWSNVNSPVTCSVTRVPSVEFKNSGTITSVSVAAYPGTSSVPYVAFVYSDKDFKIIEC